MSDCLFCKIVGGQIPADKVLETEHVLAFKDINPQAPVHVLVVPKLHVSSLLELEPSHREALGQCMDAVNEVARKHRLDASGFRVVTNHGPEAGQSVFHLHFHVLGGRRMRWPPG